MSYIYNFDKLHNYKVNEVGDKNASLGEMFQQLQSKGIRIPDGFASSSKAYWDYLQENDVKEKIKDAF